MIDYMIQWIKSHKLQTLLLAIGIFLIPIFIIHFLFKWHTSIYIMNAEWSAGELLNYLGSYLAFLGTVALGALALWQNHRFHQYHIESLEPMLSMKLYSLNHKLFLSIKNSGQTEAKNLNITINDISNNGENKLLCDDLFKMSFELYPDETVQGMIAFDGSNICTNIFPQIDVTVSYLRPDIQRKREIKRTVTFNNGYEQKISADINIDNHKTEENLGSVARACVRIANYLDGHNLASFDNLDITPNRSLHDDIVTAINTKKEIHVLERSETLEECFGKKAKNIHMKNKSKK